MPEERPKRESMTPLRRKLAKWAAIASTISSCVAGIAILGSQTCGEIRSARKDARQSEVKAEAGYETLQPAVTELQEIATEASEWAMDVDEDIDLLHDYIHDLEMQLAKHEAYFDMLKAQNHSLRRVQYSTPEPAVSDFRPPRDKKPKAAPKLEELPANIEQAMQQVTK